MRLGSPLSRLRWRLAPKAKARALAWCTGLTLVIVVVLADTGQLEPWLTVLRSVPQGDKLGHLTLMGALAFSVAQAVPYSGETSHAHRVWRGIRLLWLVVCLEELSQFWIPTRSLDVLDLAADTVGMIAGAIMGIWRVNAKVSSRLTPARDSHP